MASANKSRILLVASGPFDGLAHEPQRHGVQPACVVLPGRSGGPGGVIDPLRQVDRDDRRTTNVELWLQSLQLTLDCGEVVHRVEGVGVVLAQHPPAGAQDLLQQLAGARQVAEVGPGGSPLGYR